MTESMNYLLDIELIVEVSVFLHAFDITKFLGNLEYMSVYRNAICTVH
jgi:hypothetical protein